MEPNQPIQAAPLLADDLVPDRALAERDPDAFDHARIAARVADLCCEVDAPLNIALFGPWGSGKSSLVPLIQQRLDERKTSAKLIRYDAWRYGGEGLRRNFIAHAARELRLPEDDPDYAEFHRGLYETHRRVDVSAPRLRRALRAIPLRFFVLFAVLTAVYAIVAGTVSVLTEENFFGEIDRSMTAFLSAGALFSLLLLVLRSVFDVGKVDVEQSEPSADEQFSATFRRLVQRALTARDVAGMAQRAKSWLGEAAGTLGASFQLYRLRIWWHGRLDASPLPPPTFSRLIFFIDELDRCTPGDVVQTLKAIRTFLDEEGCVFVVAADRQVLEAALDRVEQSTPIDEDDPSYGTASAFLDKIFQHQISLPPLRGRRLTKFGRQLVAEKAGGLWAELAQIDRTAEGETPFLDLVLFTLIPSHVRSPRRVKILLNNFAANARVAQSRLPGCWPDRARELARLTALQTEFAEFAADLPQVPRLPRFLLRPKDAPPAESVRELLERWDLEHGRDPDPFIPEAEEEGSEDERSPSDADSESFEEVEEEVEPQRIENGERLKASRLDRARRRRRQQLRRYLERTDDVDDFRRDLFYLQSAGQDVGLDDPDLAEAIEQEATDSPAAVKAALVGRSEPELLGAGRLLASMIQDVLGPERRLIMTSLMDLVITLDNAADKAARDVVGAVKTYRSGAQLDEQHLVGALRIALAVKADEPQLVASILDDPRLWSSPDRVQAVVPLAPLLDDEQIKLLRRGLINHVGTHPEALTSPLPSLRQEHALRVLADDSVLEAYGEAVELAAKQTTKDEEA